MNEQIGKIITNVNEPKQIGIVWGKIKVIKFIGELIKPYKSLNGFDMTQNWKSGNNISYLPMLQI